MNVLNNLVFKMMSCKSILQVKNSKKEAAIKNNIFDLILIYLRPERTSSRKAYTENIKNTDDETGYEYLFTDSINIKINIIFLIFSVVLMVLYAFIINYEFKFIRMEKSKIFSVEKSKPEYTDLEKAESKY